MRQLAAVLLALLGCSACDMVDVYRGQIDRASQAIAAAKTDGERAAAYAERGRAYSNKGRLSVLRRQIPRDEYVRLFDLALADHNRAVGLASSDATLYFERGLTYYDRAAQVQGIDADRKRWFDAARDDFVTAAGLDPGRATAHDYLGLVEEQTGRFDEAITAYTQVLKLEPRLGKSRLAELYCTRGRSRLRESEYALAAIDFEKSIEFVGTGAGCSCEPYNPLAHIYIDATGQYDRGWDLVRRAQRSGHSIAGEYVNRLTKASSRP